MSEKTEVLVQSLRISLTNQNRLLLLKDKNGPLSLPLFVGQFEAEAIVLSLQEIEISRLFSVAMTSSSLLGSLAIKSPPFQSILTRISTSSKHPASIS